MKQFCLKFTLLVLVVVFSAGIAFSQNISYGYDAAGNRIKREIIISSNNNSRKGVKKSSFTESLNDKTIKIYPNPTKGLLKIEIGG